MIRYRGPGLAASPGGNRPSRDHPSLTQAGSPFAVQRHRRMTRGLGIDVLGLRFPNPIGLAAGFDKDAEVPTRWPNSASALSNAARVTPRPQPGNPKPRLFRLREDRAVINRMGFNNGGMERWPRSVCARRSRRASSASISAPTRIPPTASPITRSASKRLRPFADYVTVNVSSPNTPGLRGLQNREELQRLLDTVLTGARAADRARPLLLKIAPDLDGQRWTISRRSFCAAGIEGLIVSNTTIAPASLQERARTRERRSFRHAAVRAVDRDPEADAPARRHRSCSSVWAALSSGADAYAKIRAGASLVQLYTALAYQGPGLVARIKRELLEFLVRDGFADVTAAVGRHLSQKEMAAETGDGFRGVFLPHLGARIDDAPSLPRDAGARVARRPRAPVRR